MNASSNEPAATHTLPIARAHLALVLLAELSFELGQEFIPHLPVMLQLIFLCLDSALSTLHEHARVLLLNLVHSLVTQQAHSGTLLPTTLVSLLSYITL